jgi:hypothetical protein
MSVGIRVPGLIRKSDFQRKKNKKILNCDEFKLTSTILYNLSLELIRIILIVGHSYTHSTCHRLLHYGSPICSKIRGDFIASLIL